MADLREVIPLKCNLEPPRPLPFLVDDLVPRRQEGLCGEVERGVAPLSSSTIREMPRLRSGESRAIWRCAGSRHPRITQGKEGKKVNSFSLEITVMSAWSRSLRRSA